MIGRCNLNSQGEAIEQTGYGKFSCTKQVREITLNNNKNYYNILKQQISYYKYTFFTKMFLACLVFKNLTNLPKHYQKGT